MKEKKKLSLPIKIFIGMALGIVAGLICAFANLGAFTKEWIKPIGTIYVNLLKFLVVPVVLFSIADGVISLNDLKRVGSVGLKTFTTCSQPRSPLSLVLCWSIFSRATSRRFPPQSSESLPMRLRKPPLL